MAGSRTVAARAPAKINLALSVGPRLSHGYHELATVYQAVSLYDEVSATRSTSAGFQVRVEGVDAAAVPDDHDNLAVRAAAALAAHHRVDEPVTLHIRKAIPLAAGLAGGSADAAAALVACDALWQTRTPLPELLTVAASLGSDVPFCLVGGTALGTGHGEIVTPALARGTQHWVLAIAERGLATPAVYSELDHRRVTAKRGEDSAAEQRAAVPAALMAALRSGDTTEIGRVLCNDLQEPALRLRPRLSLLLDAGTERGAVGALVSGSGPTCMFLARDAQHALDLAVQLTATGLCRTALRAFGPVPGARAVRAE